MSNWIYDGGRAAIGIDVGWSKTKRSCAMAVVGLTPPKSDRAWKT